MRILFILMLLSSATGFAYNPQFIEKAALDNSIPKSTVDYLLAYLVKYESTIENKNYVTFVDFRKPSSEERMIIINSDTGQAEKYLVAHGINSGELYAEKFSNTPDSRKSSLGLYLVTEQYQGKNGESLKLEGLNPTNSNAKNREIVIHTADYVSERWVAEQGRLGRSWGCFALNQTDFLRNIIHKIKKGSLMLAFK